MKKLSVRPSPAMIVACVALFMALGGTATAVTYVVSSNSQVGPNTISGHAPPSGKHANIIGGSINAADTNTASIQKRVTGSCPAGQAARSVTQAGGVSCGATNGGTPGGSAGGDLAGSYPSPSIAADAIGAGQLAPVGDTTNFSAAPVEAVPFVIRSHVDTGQMSGVSSVDDVIYNSNAPRAFTVIDAWVDDNGSGADVSWELRTGTGGGGNVLTDQQGLGSFGIRRMTGNLRPGTSVPKNGTLVARVFKSSPGNSSADFDLYVLALPAP